MKTVYLIVGVPGSGKSWVTSQLTENFNVVPHDDYNERIYPSMLFTEAERGKPVLGEIPFGLSKIQETLTEHGVKVVPVFIIVPEQTLYTRWQERGTKRSAIAGHLTRQRTYQVRAEELGAFSGTAAEVLAHLQGVKP